MFDDRIESRIAVTTNVVIHEMNKDDEVNYYQQLKRLFTKTSGQFINYAQSVIDTRKLHFVLRPFIFVEVSKQVQPSSFYNFGIGVTKRGFTKENQFSFKIDISKEFDPSPIVRVFNKAYLEAKSKHPIINDYLEELTCHIANKTFNTYQLGINAKLDIDPYTDEITGMYLRISELPK